MLHCMYCKVDGRICRDFALVEEIYLQDGCRGGGRGHFWLSVVYHVT
jgi:hypothetical protein